MTTRNHRSNDALAGGQALAPGRPRRLIGGLQGGPPRNRLVPAVVTVPLAVAGTVVLGAIGFRQLRPAHLSWPASIYDAVKLYALDLGPAIAPGEHPPPILWLAFALAGFQLVRSFVAVARRRLSDLVMRYLLRDHVIICGAGTHGTELTAQLAATTDVVLVDHSTEAAGMQAVRSAHEWRLVGSGTRRDTLLAAGASRASWIVALTGDDFVNSQIAGVVNEMAADGETRDGLQVMVQIENPSLARFLEAADQPGEDPAAVCGGLPGGRPAARSVVVSSFSPNDEAAEALLRSSEVLVPGGRRALLDVPAGGAPHILLAGDHVLLESLVLASLREWRARQLAVAVAERDRFPAINISLFGPGATATEKRVRTRFRPEPGLMRLWSYDSGPYGEATVGAEQWLERVGVPDHVFVVCDNELNAIGLTLELSRAFGGNLLMTRVSTELRSVLDERLYIHTAARPDFATAAARSLAGLACRSDRLGRLAGRQRLVDELAPSLGRSAAQEAVERLYASEGRLGLRLDPAWRVRRSEAELFDAVLRAQTGQGQGDPLPVPLPALVSAGLRMDPTDPADLAGAARILARSGSPAAFTAWCECARAVLRLGLPPEVVAPEGEHDRAGRGQEVLALVAAILGNRQPMEELLQPEPAVLSGATRVAILAGGAASLPADAATTLLPMLERALVGFDGVVLSGGTTVGLPGLAGRAARRQGIRLVGYVPAGRGDPQLYPVLRTTAETDFGFQEPLAMWADILAAGIAPSEVRLVTFPGGVITMGEVLLARALGAKVAWVDAQLSPWPLDELLPFGYEGVWELPADAMTIRSFITPSRLGDPILRDRIAQAIHDAYRATALARREPGDPSLASWNELLPSLQDSNRAQADDIPNKLALLGLRLVPGGGRLELTDEQVELLAEVEHGRWNVERIASGWVTGDRQVARSSTPHLRAWADLDPDTRRWDIAAVRSIGPILESVGYGVEAIPAPSGPAAPGGEQGSRLPGGG